MAHAGCRASAGLELESSSASLGYRESTLASILREELLVYPPEIADNLFVRGMSSPPTPINFTGAFALMPGNAAVRVGVISLVV